MSTSVPASITDLKNFIKARLGDNVINIEMTTDQYDIVIEEALRRFYDYAYDGYEEAYIEITMPTTGLYTMDNTVLSVVDVQGALDYMQVDLAYMTEGLSQITDNRKYSFEFTRTTHILKIHTAIQLETDMGVKVYKKLDATTYTDIYNHPWLKQYVVGLARRQWGQNIAKYGSVILPGGMTLESDKILEIANAELEAAEEDLFNSYSYKPLPQVL